MAIHSDVFIVGGGIAGMTAALAAADQGVSVRVARKSDSTLRQATGLGDVLGYTDTGFVADPFAELGTLQDTHPYSLVGETGIRAGLERFDSVTGAAYRGAETDRNALVPTHGGSVKPTARYPESVAAGLASDDRDMLLVGFEGLIDVDAPLVAAHLRNIDVPFDVRGATIPFPLDFAPDAPITRYAQAFDTDATDLRARVANHVAPIQEGEPRIGFPAVLGLHQDEKVRNALESALDAAIFELPMGPPSIPGIRLEHRFKSALEEAGVTVVGNPVGGYESDGGRIQSVTVERTGQWQSYTATQFVLATGGLVGRGINSDRSAVTEPVFDCWVPHPEHRNDWFVDDRLGAHPFARFGVRVADELRPVTATGRPEFENLRAAGSVIGGYDFAAEGSGTGVSLATGEIAGRNAGENVS